MRGLMLGEAVEAVQCVHQMIHKLSSSPHFLCGRCWVLLDGCGRYEKFLGTVSEHRKNNVRITTITEAL